MVGTYRGRTIKATRNLRKDNEVIVTIETVCRADSYGLRNLYLNDCTSKVAAAVQTR